MVKICINRHAWLHPTNSNSLTSYPSLVTISLQKKLTCWMLAFRNIDDQRIRQCYWTGVNFSLSLETGCIKLKYFCLLRNKSFILSYFQPDNERKTIKRNPWWVSANLGKGGYALKNPTKSSSLWCHLLFVNISIEKIEDIYAFLPEILIIKESCNLIGWEHFGNSWNRIFSYRFALENKELQVRYFILGYFQHTVMTKVCAKKQENFYFGAFLLIAR